MILKSAKEEKWDFRLIYHQHSVEFQDIFQLLSFSVKSKGAKFNIQSLCKWFSQFTEIDYLNEIYLIENLKYLHFSRFKAF